MTRLVRHNNNGIDAHEPAVPYQEVDNRIMSSTLTERPTRATDPTMPLSIYDPIRDDNVYELWLVPGDWARGKALAYVAHETGIAFTELRARRCYLCWEQVAVHGRYWQLDDGCLVGCEKADPYAERYWEVAPR